MDKRNNNYTGYSKKNNNNKNRKANSNTFNGFNNSIVTTSYNNNNKSKSKSNSRSNSSSFTDNKKEYTKDNRNKNYNKDFRDSRNSKNYKNDRNDINNKDSKFSKNSRSFKNDFKSDSRKNTKNEFKSSSSSEYKTDYKKNRNSKSYDKKSNNRNNRQDKKKSFSKENKRFDFKPNENKEIKKIYIDKKNNILDNLFNFANDNEKLVSKLSVKNAVITESITNHVLLKSSEDITKSIKKDKKDKYVENLYINAHKAIIVEYIEFLIKSSNDDSYNLNNFKKLNDLIQVLSSSKAINSHKLISNLFGKKFSNYIEDILYSSLQYLSTTNDIEIFKLNLVIITLILHKFDEPFKLIMSGKVENMLDTEIFNSDIYYQYTEILDILLLCNLFINFKPYTIHLIKAIDSWSV